MRLSLSEPDHHNRSRFHFVIPHRYRKSIGVAGVQLEKTLVIRWEQSGQAYLARRWPLFFAFYLATKSLTVATVAFEKRRPDAEKRYYINVAPAEKMKTDGFLHRATLCPCSIFRIR